MGVQIPHRVYSQVQEEDVVRADKTASWGSVPQVSRAEGKPDRGGSSATGPRAHADLDPPKYAVSQVVGFIKGKSAIYVARVYGERKRNFVGQSFWARGFFVSTVGRDVIREYIKNQEAEDNRLEQLNLWR
jgi:putative transposase